MEVFWGDEKKVKGAEKHPHTGCQRVTMANAETEGEIGRRPGSESLIEEPDSQATILS